jgi:hypothetical protein
MAYKVASTGIRGDSFRPWNARLGRVYPSSGLGDYERAVFSVPTPTIPYAGQPVTGTLGQTGLSSLTSSPLFWLAAAGGAWWLWKRSKRG